MGSKISCLRKNEEEGIIGKVSEVDNNRKSSNVSLLGLECILFYFDTRKRLELSLYYPGFRILEKQCPLTLDSLYISMRIIKFDETEYKFDSNNVRHLIFVLDNVHIGVLRFVQKLFVGRICFRVGKLQCTFEIPFKLSIDCERVHVDSTYRECAVNYSNVIRKVDRLLIFCIRSPDDLKYPWIQNVKTVELYSFYLMYLLPVLGNIPAETICVRISWNQEPYEFDDLIRVWCENRNGRIGSQLFIIMWDLRQNYIFCRLEKMGFIAETDERWRLPMKNNSVARLSIRDDYDRFQGNNVLCSPDCSEYFCLEVVNS